MRIKIYSMVVALISIFALLACGKDKTDVSRLVEHPEVETQDVSAAPNDNWSKNEEKYTDNGIEYHYKKSEDGKHCWICGIDNTDSSNLDQLVIPKKIDKLIPTRLGSITKKKEEFGKNIFGETVEEAHGASGVTEEIKNIKKLSIPESINEIAWYAFSGMESLEEVSFPGNLEKIGDYVLYGCKKLSKVSMSKNVKTFSPRTFAGCEGLSEISISEDNPNFKAEDGLVITKSDNKLFMVVPALKRVVVPDGISVLGEDCMIDSKALSIYIPESVETIEKNAIAASKLSEIELAKNSGTFSMDRDCLYRKDDNTLVAGILKKGKLTVSSEVKEINSYAMMANNQQGNSGFKRLVIPSSVKVLKGDWADFCMNVKEIEFEGEVPPVISDLPEGTSALLENITYIVPSKAKDEYKKWFKANDLMYYKLDNR